MNQLLQNLNWGFPYHIIVTCALFHILFLIYYLIFPRMKFRTQIPVIICSGVSYFFMLLYEWYQGFEADFVQDMTGNVIGLFIAIMIFTLYSKTLRY
jgi:hypothetical protein